MHMRIQTLASVTRLYQTKPILQNTRVLTLGRNHVNAVSVTSLSQTKPILQNT